MMKFLLPCLFLLAARPALAKPLSMSWNWEGHGIQGAGQLASSNANYTLRWSYQGQLAAAALNVQQNQSGFMNFSVNYQGRLCQGNAQSADGFVYHGSMTCWNGVVTPVVIQP